MNRQNRLKKMMNQKNGTSIKNSNVKLIVLN